MGHDSVLVPCVPVGVGAAVTAKLPAPASNVYDAIDSWRRAQNNASGIGVLRD